MITDDLPWPELGNVSRGATRGNQGSKGALGLQDASGRAVLQLRVQPGVLAVKLNPTAASWYRLLDGEVQRALKETKTYWRKARRRQDYDPRADQDHMELHEWLQQLKDKAMAHLELLLQKGEITGPPYVMPDHAEFTFMRGFVERQRAGIHHNPRLRNLPRDEQHRIPPEDLADDDLDARGSPESVGSPLRSPVSVFTAAARPASSSSPTWSKIPTSEASSSSSPTLDFAHKIEMSQNTLRQSRSRLKLARAASQDAYSRFTQCSEQERILEAEVLRGEERFDELITALLQHAASAPGPSTSLSVTGPSPDLHIHTHGHTQQPHSGQGQAHGPAPPSSASTPITTSAPNGPGTSSSSSFDAIARMVAHHPAQVQHAHPASHSHAQQQQQQAQAQAAAQMTQYQQQPYLWNTTPQRPGSSVSVSSAPGGLSLDLANGHYTGGTEIPLGSAGGNRGEDWATAGGGGRGGPASDEGIGEAMMHAVSRVASPQRKHPREWDTSSQQQPHQQQQMTMRDSDESAPHPPRKRMNHTDVSGGANIPLALSLGSPVHGSSPHAHQQQQQQQHAYHAASSWQGFSHDS